MYRTIINEIDPTANARHVEAWMRLQYGTLDHLSRMDFIREIQIAKQCEEAEPGSGEALAQSFGLPTAA